MVRTCWADRRITGTSNPSEERYAALEAFAKTSVRVFWHVENHIPARDETLSERGTYLLDYLAELGILCSA